MLTCPEACLLNLADHDFLFCQCPFQLSLPLQAMFEAEPRYWESGSFQTPAIDNRPPLVVFCRGIARGVKMDLAQLERSENTHLEITASSVQLDDLRYCCVLLVLVD